jgi:predicted nucleotide-binding protein
MVYPTSPEIERSRWISGVSSFANLVNTIIEEIALFDISATVDAAEAPSNKAPEKAAVFLVHGHDDLAKTTVARFLERLDLDVIILHERASVGDTIIEKFERESSGVGFAVVLLTADDLGSAKESSTGLSSRARQNVVFELGFFVAALGRSKVVALREPNVEIPSDLAGVMYIAYEPNDSWKLSLAGEIRRSGIGVDMNKALP